MIWEVEGLYYLCSKNKGTDKLYGYRPAALHHSFRIWKKQVFSKHGSQKGVTDFFSFLLNVPVNNFSVMSGRSHLFLSIFSTLGSKCVLIQDTTRQR